MNLSLSVPVIAGWGAWLTVGLMLLVWARRAHESALQQEELRSISLPVPPRRKSGVRTPKPASAPVDAFGELAAMLEPDADLSAARRPGD